MASTEDWLPRKMWNVWKNSLDLVKPPLLQQEAKDKFYRQTITFFYKVARSTEVFHTFLDLVNYLPMHVLFLTTISV